MQAKERVLLGLSRHEEKVLSALAKEPLGVSALAREIKLPRTSLNYALKKLHQRGLVVTKPHGKRRVWTMHDNLELRDRFFAVGESFAPAEKGISSFAVSPEMRIEIFRGSKNLLRLWHMMTDLDKFERLYCIQPDASFNAALGHALGGASYQEILDINAKIKARKIIVEALVHEHSAHTIPETLAAREVEPAQFLGGFVGRLADTMKLPPEFMDVSAEMYLYRETFVIINWAHEVGITITNKEISQFFKSLFEAAKYLSHKYDQNERMAQKIVELGSAQS